MLVYYNKLGKSYCGDALELINTIENAKTVYDIITGQCDLPIDINLY